MVRNFLIFALVSLSFLVFSKNAAAAVKIWDGGGADNNWTTALNWSGDTAPISGDDIVFDATSVKASTVNATFTASPASISVNAGYTNTIAQSRNLSVSGNFSVFSGTWAIGTYNLIISGNSTISGGAVTIGILTTTGWTTANMTIGTGGTVTCSGNSRINVSGNWDSSLGTWTRGTSSVYLTGTGVLKTNGSWTGGFNWLSVAAAGRTTTLESSVYTNFLNTNSATGTLTDGINSYGIYLTGNNNVLTGNNSTITINILYYRASSGGTQNIAGRDYTGIGTLAIYGNGGLFNNNYNLQGNIIAGTMWIGPNNNAAQSAVDILNTNNYSITATSLNVGSLSNSLYCGMINAGSSVFNVTGFTVRSSNTNCDNTLNADNSTWNVSSNWSNSDIFNAGTSTINLIGVNQTIYGINSFYNLTKSTVSAATLTFPASVVTTIAGTLTLNGSAGQPLSLRSFTNNVAFTLADLGTESVNYVDVKDSTAIDSIIGFNSADSGNNTNWFFSSNSPGPLRYACGLGTGTQTISVTASGTLPTAGVWAHVACVVSGNTLSIYVNGVNEGSATFVGVPQINDNSLYFGQANSGGQWFSGDIDETALWSRPLSLTEIEGFSLMCYDLGSYFKDYLNVVPKDPTSGTDEDTGYAISREASGVITVQSVSPQSIDNQTPEIKASR